MKKFLKHCNRGLLLALAVLLGLIIYLKIDGIRFQEAKPDIEKAVTDYLEEVKQVNLAAPKEKLSQCRSLLGRRWASHGLQSGGYYGQQKYVMEDYLSILEDRPQLPTEVTDYTDVFRNISVSPFGPGCAKAVVPYNASLTLASPDPDYVLLGLQSGDYYYSDPTQKDSSQINRSLVLTFYLQETEGTWQILSISAEENPEG